MELSLNRFLFFINYVIEFFGLVQTQTGLWFRVSWTEAINCIIVLDNMLFCYTLQLYNYIKIMFILFAKEPDWHSSNVISSFYHDFLLDLCNVEKSFMMLVSFLDTNERIKEE